MLLHDYANRSDVRVVALPRGGVPVAYEVASALLAPLDVLLVRKLGVPGRPELAMGAIAAGGVEVVSEDLIQQLRISRSLVAEIAARERVELDRRDRVYRGGGQPSVLGGCTVILVDDGLATGSTMEAAILAVRQRAPLRSVVAVPVGARDACARRRGVADEVVCPVSPEPFTAVGLWYAHFPQTSDDEVIRLLAAGVGGRAGSPAGPAPKRGSLGAVRRRAQPRALTLTGPWPGMGSRPPRPFRPGGHPPYEQDQT